jgi:hypothetical protein
MDIALTSPTPGTLGCVGRLEIEATIEEVLVDSTLAQEITGRAQTLVGDPGSRPAPPRKSQIANRKSAFPHS